MQLDELIGHEWTTLREVITQLQIEGIPQSERQIRILIEEHNERYFNHEEKYFIAHSCKGRKLCTCEDPEYWESVSDWKSRAYDLLKKIRKAEKRKSEDGNLHLNLKENGESNANR